MTPRRPRRRFPKHLVRDIVLSAIADVAATDPDALKRALLSALRGRARFATLATLAAKNRRDKSHG